MSPVLLAVGYLRKGEAPNTGVMAFGFGALLAAFPLATAKFMNAGPQTFQLVALLCVPAGLWFCWIGLRTIFTYNVLRFDPANGVIEEARVFLGREDADDALAGNFDRVVLQQVGDSWYEFELRLLGPGDAEIYLGAFEYRPAAMYLGLRVARAGGFAYEEQLVDLPPFTLAPAQLAHLPAPDSVASDRRPWWQRPSTVALVAANLLPLWGVLHSRWDVASVLMLYWGEMLVIGAVALVRIALAGGDPVTGKGSYGVPVKLLACFGFVMLFGGFAKITGGALLALFGGVNLGHDPTLLELLRVGIFQRGLGWALLALAVSHGFAFRQEYLRPGAWEDDWWKEAAAVPFRRVLLIFFVLIGASIGVQEFGGSPGPVALLVLLKLTVDLGAHERELASPWRHEARRLMGGVRRRGVPGAGGRLP